jgi:hypothetical protein
MSSTPAKDVIYVDIDDEITAIIDKIQASHSKILALVLPKRATTLQSVVNMKLLKRSADEHGKNVVLITNETGLLPLAANVGLHVAKNLQSKPEIPAVPTSSQEQPDDDAEETISMDDTNTPSKNARSLGAQNPINRSAAVGDLARGNMPPSIPDEDTISMDDAAPSAGVFGPAASPATASSKKPLMPKGPKNKKLAVPNFDKFRMWIILGVVALVALIGLWILCFKVLPRADILVKTDSTAISTTLDLTLNTSVDQLNAEALVIPAQSQQTKKTVTQQANATGQKNVGEKASGTLVIVNCNDNTVSLPAGTGFSAGGMTYVSTKAVSVSGSNFNSDGKCKKDGRDSVNVVAQNPGASYNAGSRDYTIANGPTGVTASGDEMAGGTDEVKRIVQQSDIDNAKQKIEAQDTTAIKQQLQSQLSNMGLYAVSATFNQSASAVTSSVNAGDEADNVTVTQVVTYSMMGVKQADLKTVIGDSVKDKIDESKQSIIDYGLGKAVFTVQGGSVNSLRMQTTAVAGPDLKIADLTKQVAGKKTGDAKQIIKNNPGVTDVTVQYSPFWVSSIPSNQSKVHVTIDEPQVKKNAD